VIFRKTGSEHPAGCQRLHLLEIAGGHTLFTLHASKLIQYKGGGRATLHNVSITLYGKDGTRNDHVYGNDFEYDRLKHRACGGPVHLDVQAARRHQRHSAAEPYHPCRDEWAGLQSEDGRRLDRCARDLLRGGREGHGRRASYDANEGVLILQRDVHFMAQLTKGPLVLTAEHAEFTATTRQLSLLKDDVRYAGEHQHIGRGADLLPPGRHSRKGRCRGHVNMQNDQGRQLHASAVEVLMDARGNTQQATLDGGLLFSAAEGPHSIHGDANSGILQLGPDGELKRVEMHNASRWWTGNRPPNDPHGSVTREVKGRQSSSTW